MTRFQSGVVAEANTDAQFITLNMVRSADAVMHLREVLAQIPATESQFRPLPLVVSIGIN